MAGLLLDGLELQDLDAGYWFDVVDGGPDDVPEVIGEDDEVMGAPGLEAGNWIKRSRPVRLFGVVFGDGATDAAARESYRTRMDALVAKMQVSDLHDLVAHPPNFGLAAATAATLSNVRPQRIVGAPARQDASREMTLELVSIDSPPEWVVA